jgi:hypothetical protein
MILPTAEPIHAARTLVCGRHTILIANADGSTDGAALHAVTTDPALQGTCESTYV